MSYQYARFIFSYEGCQSVEFRESKKILIPDKTVLVGQALYLSTKVLKHAAKIFVQKQPNQRTQWLDSE